MQNSPSQQILNIICTNNVWAGFWKSNIGQSTSLFLFKWFKKKFIVPKVQCVSIQSIAILI